MSPTLFLQAEAVQELLKNDMPLVAGRLNRLGEGIRSNQPLPHDLSAQAAINSGSIGHDSLPTCAFAGLRFHAQPYEIGFN